MATRVSADGLDAYQVGARVRRLRLRKKISLKELGRHTGLSPALLSKLERRQVMPTLPTLMRIALVFGVGLEEFFVNRAPGAVVTRSAQRLRFPERPDDADSAFDFECLDFSATNRQLNAYYATFRVGVPGRPHAHDQAELLFLLSGSLRLDVDGIEHRLEAGDAIYIHPSVPHTYACVGEAPCAAVVVTTAGSPGAGSERRLQHP